MQIDLSIYGHKWVAICLCHKTQIPSEENLSLENVHFILELQRKVFKCVC